MSSLILPYFSSSLSQVNVKDATGFTPLYLASTYTTGSEATVKVLLEHGAVVNHITPKGMTPLHAAAMAGSAAVIQLLLDGGGKPHYANPFTGMLPIHYAAESGSVDAVKVLLKAKCNPTIRNKEG